MTPGDLTRRTIAAQPKWLRGVAARVGRRRLPAGNVLFTGCGTSFHAAQTAGAAVQALEAVVSPPDADVLVVVSHEGTTPMSLDAAAAFTGERWLVTGGRPASDEDEPGTPSELFDEVVHATPQLEQSLCHTASYTCAVATLCALRGEDVSGLPDAVAAALAEPSPVASAHERWLVVGAGASWPTAQEAVLKLREGAFVAAEAHHTEQLLHGHLAAVDESVRAFVFDGPGAVGERVRAAVAALRVLGCDTTLMPSRHPVVDIVFFQRLMLALAELRGTNPDLIRRDDERWRRAREAYR